MAEVIDERASAPPATAHVALSRRFIVAATVGNALEFYDFITYAFFSIQIGQAFFPSHDAYASLMLSLATFGAGFVTRPVGAIVIGRYSDRVGRRPAMMFSFTLMGAAIILLALIPPYAKIGVAAPILAVLARMAQGFSLGGEVGPTTAFLLEAAPLNGRGLAVAWQGASQNIASAAGSLVGVGLSSLMAPAALDAYGWRIAFLLGAATLPFGLLIRRGLPETLHAPDAATQIAGTRKGLALLRDNRRIIILSLAALAAATTGSYVFNYMVTFAQSTLNVPPRITFLASALGNGAGVVALLWGGWLSDRIGRRPVMIWPNLVFLVLILPVFFWIIAARDALALIVGTTVLGFIRAMSGGALYAAMMETLPKRIRAGAFAIIYAVSIALFGGATQLVVTGLIKVTGNPMALAWYLFAATVVGQAALSLIRESAPAKTRPATVTAR